MRSRFLLPSGLTCPTVLSSRVVTRFRTKDLIPQCAKIKERNLYLRKKEANSSKQREQRFTAILLTSFSVY